MIVHCTFVQYNSNIPNIPWIISITDARLEDTVFMFSRRKESIPELCHLCPLCP